MMDTQLNGYIAFFNSKRHELRAPTLYAAKLAAITYFKPRKSQEHMVTVMLAELGDQPVIHTPVD